MLKHSDISKQLQPGRYYDVGGLHLRVSDAGRKVWILRLPLDGAKRDIKLAPFPEVGLAAARKLAKAERERLLAAGSGGLPAPPKFERNGGGRPESAGAPTFLWCAEAYIRERRAGWVSRHADVWAQTMRDYVAPIIGGMAVDQITRKDVMGVVSPIWASKTETASRVLARIRVVMAWAKVNGHRHGDNPAEWRDNISLSLPDRRKVAPVVHREALPFHDIPEFIAKLRELNGVAPKALLFTILTAARSGEARGAVWGEIDAGSAEWVIPASRMKAGKEHRVPLVPQTLAIIGEKPLDAGDADFVFPSVRVGRRNGALISAMMFCRLLKGMGYPTLTTHGFRSTFRDWAAEETDHTNEVVEMALAHAIGSKVEAAYRRGNLLEKRRLLMAEWADYCCGMAVPRGGAV